MQLFFAEPLISPFLFGLGNHKQFLPKNCLPQKPISYQIFMACSQNLDSYF